MQIVEKVEKKKDQKKEIIQYFSFILTIIIVENVEYEIEVDVQYRIMVASIVLLPPFLSIFHEYCKKTKTEVNTKTHKD